jgi:hypothetical protein
MGGLRWTVPALAGKLWRGSAFARCAREGVIVGPLLFSVVFKPADFIGFHTVTDSFGWRGSAVSGLRSLSRLWER